MVVVLEHTDTPVVTMINPGGDGVLLHSVVTW
jgi:hypothetical protein